MADDFAGDTTTTGVLPVGGSVSGVIENPSDSDWFAIVLTEGQHIELTGPMFIDSVRFYDASGQILPLDFFPIFDSTYSTGTVGFTAPSSGTFYVGFSYPSTNAHYTLTTTVGTGANPNNLSNYALLHDGDVQSGNLSAGEQARFAVTLAAGETFVIEGMQSVVGLSASGERLAAYDQVGETSLDRFTVFTATGAGTYYFHASNYQPGPYSLSAKVYVDDFWDGEGTPGAPIEQLGLLDSAGDQVSGTIEVPSDDDHFEFNLVAGQTVRLRLDFAELHSFATAFEVSYGGTGYGEGGTYVAQLQTEELGELIFTAPVTGTYHLNVSGSPSYTGSYNLSIETVASGSQFDGQPSIVTPPPARPAQATHATTVEMVTGGTFTVAAGTTIYTVNIDKSDQPPGSPYFGYGGSPAVQASNSPQFSTVLNNAGVIRNYNDNGKDAAGVGVDTLINSGAIIAETVSPYLGRAYTTHGGAMAVKLINGDVTNTGLIHASAELGSALGIRTSSTGKTITNSGVISATATVGPDPALNGYAAAIYSVNDVEVVNSASGKILAEADGTAVGIYLGFGGSVENRGLIEAHARGIHAESIGIVLDTIGPGYVNVAGLLTQAGVSIHNYGVIRADVAIQGGDTASTNTNPQHGVFNHLGGLIEGDIRLGIGNDGVWNEGVITGDVDMGKSRDIFDNTGGQVNGLINMGSEDDTFIGGSFGDVVVGGTGKDTLSGNGGNDLLIGGVGNDVITGGAGNDGLYGEFGADRIVTQSGDIADGGTGGDRIETLDLAFISIAGGAGHDVWALPTGARTLDLGQIAGTGRVSGIDEIELSGSQIVVVRPADVATLSDGQQIFLTGTATDNAYLAGSWTAGASVQLNGITYARYTLEGATVFVDADVAVTIGNTPPAGTGLDAVAAGTAPEPGVIPGAELSSPVINTRGTTLHDIVTIEADETWQNLRGGAVFGGSAPGIGIINQGTIASVGSTDADIRGRTGSAYAIDVNNIDILDNSGLIVATAFGQGVAQTYLGSSRSGIINHETGRIHAYSEEGDAIAILGADTSVPHGSAVVDNRGDIYAFSFSGFAVALFERNGSRIENAGTIEADGGGGAIAIDLSNAGGSVFNTGDIIAFAPLSSAFYSVGVIFYSEAYLENDGRISADVAVSIIGRYGRTSTILNTGEMYGLITKTYWGPEEGGFGGLDLTNSGSIFGSILLTEGASRSTIINTGHIEGLIAFGSGSDIYDGRGGDIVGLVDGGGGNDTLRGGDRADVFDGGAGDDTIDGGGGVDTLIGGLGNDVIDGGSGADAAAFAFARAGAEIVSWRGVLAVGGAGGEGMDRLTSIEQLQFSDQTVGASSIARFDIYGYIAGYDDLMVTYGVHNLDGAVEHFINTGFAQGRDTDQFSGIQYIAGYNDLIMAFGTDEDVAGRHYIQFGVSGGRVRDNFSGADYIASYNDLIMAFGLDEDVAARHYIQFGYSSGRSRDTFDGWQYIASYDDLIVNIGADEAEAARHFVQTGYGQGRARDVYNWLEYIAGHDDLIVAFGADETAGARHYVETGFAAGRARDAFDGLQYIASYADLIQSFGEDEGRGASHYIQFGFNEGRARDTFDAAQYLANYADLQAVFGSDLYNATRHYILYGFYEGRTDNDLTPNGGDDGLAILADKGDSVYVSPAEYDTAVAHKGEPAPEVLPDDADFGALRLALDDGFLMQSFVDTSADLRAKGIVMPPEWAVLLA